MKRTLILFTFLLFSAWASAQTQQGYVKTLGRPDKAGEPLGGVSVRVKGGHNEVLSGSDGTFEMRMDGKKNGEVYALQSVQKAGYELNEHDIVGRQFAFSDKVRLEIVMVSSSVLQAEKRRIEDNAYRTAERNYKAKASQIEQQLQDSAISIQQYRERTAELQDKFEKYQSLIDGLAEHYAHTDYDFLSETDREINICIENGELERADSLINTLFDPIGVLERNMEALARIEQQMSQAQGMLSQANEDMAAVLKQQEKDAEYLYQLYTIALARYDHEKAGQYIEIRAKLDTTNADWQDDAARYFSSVLNLERSVFYYTKALELYKNLAKSNDVYHIDEARVMGEMANIYMVHDKRKSLVLREDALSICREYERSHPGSTENKIVKLGLLSSVVKTYAQIGGDIVDDDMARSILVELLSDMEWLMSNLTISEKYEYKMIGEMMETIKIFADIFLSQRNYGEAEIVYLELLNQCETLKKFYSGMEWYETISHLGLACIYASTNRLPESEVMFNKAFEIIQQHMLNNPEKYSYLLAEAKCIYGRSCQDQMRYSDSERLYNEALDIIRPSIESGKMLFLDLLAKTTLNLGNIYLMTNRIDECESLFRESLSVNKQLLGADSISSNKTIAETQMILGFVLSTKGNLMESIDLLSESVGFYERAYMDDKSVKPQYVNAMYFLAISYAMSHDYTSSFTITERLLPLMKELYEENANAWRSSYAGALLNQSYNAIILGKYAKAESHASTALIVNPSDHIVVTNLAASLLFQGRYAEAETIYRQYKNELRDSFLQDFNDFEAAGVIPEERKADVERIRQMLNE